MPNPGIQLNLKQTDPSLKDLLDLVKKDILLNLNCHALATIQSFDPETQTVSATINYKKTYFQRGANGTYTPIQHDYPILLDVPVIILGGGTSQLTFPISPNDTCLILFNDRDIDNWLESGQVQPLASTRLHSFSDGIALIGLNSMVNTIESYDTERARLQMGAAYVGVGKDDKIKVANDSTTLNTLLQSLITDLNTLITAISTITVICAAPSNPSSPPVNAAAILAVSTSLSTLATQIGVLLE